MIEKKIKRILNLFSYKIIEINQNAKFSITKVSDKLIQIKDLSFSGILILDDYRYLNKN